MKIYRWHGKKNANLGDEITIDILKHFGFDYDISSIKEADLFSTGSILSWPFVDGYGRGKETLTIIVGSGLMVPIPHLKEKIKEYKNLHLISVRGYLSRYWIGLDSSCDCSVGDPGLMVSKIYKDLKDLKKEFDFGFIPHHSHYGKSKQFFENLSKYGTVKEIDFRTGDANSVFQELNKCKVIISQGLHGLIFSDSFGIPNVWADFGDLHVGGNFKFYDYFSSINRPFDLKVNGNKDVELFDIFSNVYYPNRVLIENMIGVIEGSFLRSFDLYNKSN